MKPILILAMLLFSAMQTATDQPYELKGETPSVTTLKQFKSNHRHADCSNLTAHQTLCHVYDGVSFAGVTAMTFKGCTVPECESQGIGADFQDGLLVYLSYGVAPGETDTILKALKAKFGEPTEKDDKTISWKNSVGHLSLFNIRGRNRDGSERTAATMVVSALNDNGPSKDI